VVRIILLADQERLIRLFTDPGALPGAEVRVESRVEKALAALSSAAPDFLFIQERLGEVSGAVIAHRLETELKGKKTRIVLVGDPAGAAVSSGKTGPACLDASLSDEELAKAVQHAVAAPVAGRARRRRPQRSHPPARSSETGSDAPSPSLPTETIADIVEIGGKDSSPARDTVPRQGPASSADAALARSRFQEHLENALEVPAAAESRPAPPSAGTSAGPSEPDAGPIRVSWGKPPRSPGIIERAARSKGRFIGLFVIACVAILLLFQVFHEGKPPAGKGSGVKAGQGEGARPPLSPPAVALRALPSFIPLRSPDTGYGTAHPGWERYLNPAAEFRVYRDQGALRAIQVIDRGREGLAPSLFESALTEIAGSSRYLVETREGKGSYVIERGRLKNGFGIIIYRKEPGQKVKAFVVDFR
jgi:flagellar FliL protein